MRLSRNWLLLSLICSLALASCDRDKNKTAATDKPKPLIGVSLLTLTNPFFKEMGDTMREEGQKRGYEVVITSGEFDPAKQRDQVKDFLVRKASAIILTPCDSKSVGTAISEDNSAGVPNKSSATAQDILQAHPDLDAIFAINDPSALGAIAAIEKAGKTGKIKVIGFDGQPEAKKAVKDGKMYATVLQHPRQIASATIEAIDKYMSGEQVPPQNLIP